MTTTIKEPEVGMLVRVLVAYAAWLAMVFADLPAFASVSIVVASPMFFGSVIWHLRKTYTLSAVNRVAFCGAVAFFPFLAIQIFAMTR